MRLPPGRPGLRTSGPSSCTTTRRDRWSRRISDVRSVSSQNKNLKTNADGSVDVSLVRKTRPATKTTGCRPNPGARCWLFDPAAIYGPLQGLWFVKDLAPGRDRTATLKSSAALGRWYRGQGCDLFRVTFSSPKPRIASIDSASTPPIKTADEHWGQFTAPVGARNRGACGTPCPQGQRTSHSSGKWRPVMESNPRESPAPIAGSITYERRRLRV